MRPRATIGGAPVDGYPAAIVEAELYREWNALEGRHWWFVARRRIFLALLGRHLPPASRRILDVGCGTGRNLTALASLGQATGLDPAPGALEHCRAHALDRLTAGFLSALPFGDGSFDLVTAFDVLEHDADPERCVREVHRVLAPGGWFFVTVPAYAFMWGDHDVVAHHQKRYRSGELRQELLAGGFEIVRLTHLNTLLFPVAFVFRQLKNLLGKIHPTEPRSDFGGTAPPGVNGVLEAIFAAETPLVTRFDLPFGLSIACLARKV